MNKLQLACLAIVLFGTAAAPAQTKPANPVLPAPDALTSWNMPETPPEACPDTPATIRHIFTAEADYILWFFCGSHDQFPLASNGVLGNPNVGLLGTLGDTDNHRRDPVSGGRFTVGWWETEDNPWVPGGIRTLGVEAVFMAIGEESRSFTVGNVPVLIRPFFDLNNRQESGFIVGFPGLATGNITAHAQANLWGAETNVWKTVYYDTPGTGGSCRLMGGFRFLSADQSLNIGSVTVFEQNLAAFPLYAPFAGNTIVVNDAFSTHNRFYGPQVGVAGKFWPGPYVSIDVAAKLALGVTSEDLNISGNQVRTLANSTKVISPAGLLALPSNIGSYHRDQFAQVPEWDMKISARATDWLTVSTGFSMLYWSKILRPVQQVSRSLDITQIPNFPPATGVNPTGLAEPHVPFKEGDLLLLALSFGFEINW